MTKKISTRALSLRLSSDNKPATLNEQARSVEVVVATENRVAVYDWMLDVVLDEILLMSGCRMPQSRQVVLLDTHSRYNTSSVIGSCRNLRVQGAELIGAAHFSSAPEAEGPYTKVREGHLTDFSVGYRIAKGGSVWIAKDTTAVINGREFAGPVRVVTDWTVKELSVCPIGADEQSKARADAPQLNEDDLMDPKLRAFLERNGLAKDATEEQAWSFFARMDADAAARQAAPLVSPVPDKPTPVPAPVDQEKIRAEAVRMEQERITEISAMGARFNCAELAAELVTKNVALPQARKQILDFIGQGDDVGSLPHGSRARTGADERDKFRAAAIDALQVRAGFDPDKPAPGAHELAGHTLTELARMSLAKMGERSDGRPLEMIGRALTVSDFPNILAASANKSLFAGFDSAEETWNQWVAEGSVSNFQTHTSVRAGETDDLDEIPDATEYKYSERDEAKESYAIATYGKIYALTRQTIINDDVNALTDVPFQHGEAANRKIGDIVYAVLTANSAMGDGVALFHTASHANLAAAGAVISVTTAAAAIKAMKGQKDLSSKRRLNIRPVFFLAPITIEGAAEVFFLSQFFDATNKGATTTNPYSGAYFKRIYEPRLDDNSTTAWYLAAAKGKTVKVFFLDGIKRPYLETKAGWSVDGVEYKVRIDAGAKAMDYRGLYKNPGT